MSAPDEEVVVLRAVEAGAFDDLVYAWDRSDAIDEAVVEAEMSRRASSFVGRSFVVPPFRSSGRFPAAHVPLWRAVLDRLLALLRGHQP